MIKFDHNQQRALLEYLDHEFHQRVREETSPTGEALPEPPYDEKPLEEEKRHWMSVRWSGMKYFTDHDSDDHGWSGSITGQRSDGQYFYVNMSWKPDFEEPSDDDPMHRLRLKFLNATISFNSYRDCSCGIIGYRETGGLDSDGDPIEEAVHSPCRFHPQVSGKQLEEMFRDE